MTPEQALATAHQALTLMDRYRAPSSEYAKEQRLRDIIHKMQYASHYTGRHARP